MPIKLTTHVPGNAYVRVNPAYRDRAGAPFAYEVIEDYRDGTPHVLARVEFTHADDGKPVVWLTGGALSPDAALRLSELIVGMIERPPHDWDPSATRWRPARASAHECATDAQRQALRELGQQLRKTRERLDDELLDLIVDSALAQAEVGERGAIEWTPDRDGMPGRTTYVIQRDGRRTSYGIG